MKNLIRIIWSELTKTLSPVEAYEYHEYINGHMDL